ncbi:unnamed protein product [Alternaria alternata]
MAATNLIIALVFAGVFGAALIYVALWFIHRYIHQSCCEIEHWCHTLFSSQARPPPCVHIGKGEQREPPRHQSRSTKRERERPEGSQTRKYYEHRDEESHAARNANAGWARPMLQFNSSTQPQQQQSYGQLYYPSLEQKQWPSANQVDYPSRIQQQIPVPWQTQGVAHMPPFAMPTARTTSPRDSGPRKDQPGGEAHAVRRTNTKLNEDTRQGNERERVVTSVRDEFGGRYDRQPEQKPGKERSSTTQEVPRYSPMPIPVVGEPSTPTSVGHTSIPKVPSASGNAAGPRISSAPLSPISQIRNPLKLPRSSVSSLNKGE